MVRRVTSGGWVGEIASRLGGGSGGTFVQKGNCRAWKVIQGTSWRRGSVAGEGVDFRKGEGKGNLELPLGCMDVLSVDPRSTWVHHRVETGGRLLETEGNSRQNP